GAVFIFFMGAGGGFGPPTPSGSAVVELGHFRMDQNDFQRLRARQEQSLREQLGDSFDERAVASYLDAQTLATLVDSVVLAQSAYDLGLLVSDKEIQDLVRQSPSFQNESGRFDLDAFKSYAQWEYGSEGSFLANIRQDILRQKMVSLLYDQATVSSAEARQAALYGLEQVRIAYVQLDLESLPSGESLDQDVVSEFLDQHRDSIQVVYDESIDRYTEPEQVHARHILVQAGSEADDETVAAAKSKIDDARERIASGEDFSEVAQQVSEDPGSRDQGGDLGIFAKAENVAAIDDAAFSLEPNQASDVLRSEFGFHIVEVLERFPARTRPFAEVGPEIARRQATEQAAAERAQNLAEVLTAEIEAGRSLEEAARAQELTLERTPLLGRRPDGFIPGLGAAPDVLNEAFRLDLSAPSSSTVHGLGSQLVLLQLLQRFEPGPEELETAIQEQEEALLAAKRNGMVQQWVERRRSEWEKSGQLLVNTAAVISGS
ncbi:MAG: peptidylprolyl isomerase, partial [Myxococcota bacterium]